MATFAWEKERISNDDIKRYVTEYFAATAAKIVAPISPSSTGSDTSTSSPTSSTASTTAAVSLPPSTSSQDTSSSYSGWFGWLWPSSAVASNQSTLNNAVENNSLSSPSENSYWWNWMMGWVWSTTPTDKSSTSLNEVVAAQRHDVCQLEHARKEPNLSRAVEEQKQEADNLALLKYLQAKQEETAARMTPLSVWNDMHLGPRRIEYVLDKAKKKAASFLKEKAQQAQSALNKHSTLKNANEDPLPGTSVVDLACFGGATDFYESPPHLDDSYKLFMGIDRDTSADSARGSSSGYERSPNRAILEDIFLKFTSHTNLEETIHSNLVHFQNGLMFEGLANNHVPMLKNNHIFTETVKKGARLCRDVMSRVHSKLRLDVDSRCASKAPPNFSPRLEMDMGVSGCWRDVGDAVSKVKLVLLTEELARQLYVPVSSSVAVSREQHTDPLAGWECINKNSSYVAYRKLYKDTGLYQYKVIGQFDDITAKDFLDVQVDHQARKDWDAYAGELVVKETDKLTGCKLIHWIMKYPFPMSHREYLFVQRVWTSENNDLIVIMNKGVSHPDGSTGSNYVTVTDYYSNMVIQATSSVKQLGLRFELNYFENPHSNLPSSCVNWVTFSALPDFMSNVHAAAVVRHNS